jgi:branched-subunit amino acid ABC-type transport system permease component
MTGVAIQIIEVLNGIAFLALISIGLAIVFGMMRVINFAHGEFLMLGGYSTILSTNSGINIWVSMLVVAPVAVGIVGLIAERLVIRFLYGRIIDTLLATWGLSLFIIGLVTAVFGSNTIGVKAPLGSLAVGEYSVSLYRLVLIVIAILLVLGVFVLLRRTNIGLVARGTMQNAQMASALGVNPSRVYAATFAFGAALTGLAGGLIAPITGIVPTIGASYIAKAFITVISGGAAPVSGTASASIFYGTISQIVTFQTTPVIGQAALLIAAIVLLRLLPRGISERFFRGSL